MPTHPVILTPSTPTPDRRETAGRIAGLTLLVALIGLVAVVCLTLVLMRRRRLGEGGRRRATSLDDAWAEAGRRAGAPPAEAFESDEDRPHG